MSLKRKSIKENVLLREINHNNNENRDKDDWKPNHEEGASSSTASAMSERSSIELKVDDDTRPSVLNVLEEKLQHPFIMNQDKSNELTASSLNFPDINESNNQFNPYKEINDEQNEEMDAIRELDAVLDVHDTTSCCDDRLDFDDFDLEQMDDSVYYINLQNLRDQEKLIKPASPKLSSRNVESNYENNLNNLIKLPLNSFLQRGEKLRKTIGCVAERRDQRDAVSNHGHWNNCSDVQQINQIMLPLEPIKILEDRFEPIRRMEVENNILPGASINSFNLNSNSNSNNNQQYLINNENIMENNLQRTSLSSRINNVDNLLSNQEISITIHNSNSNLNDAADHYDNNLLPNTIYNPLINNNSINNCNNNNNNNEPPETSEDQRVLELINNNNNNIRDDNDEEIHRTSINDTNTLERTIYRASSEASTTHFSHNTSITSMECSSSSSNVGSGSSTTTTTTTNSDSSDISSSMNTTVDTSLVLNDININLQSQQHQQQQQLQTGTTEHLQQSHDQYQQHHSNNQQQQHQHQHNQHQQQLNLHHHLPITASLSNGNSNNSETANIEEEKSGFNGSWPHCYSRTMALIACTLGMFNLCRFTILTINYGCNFIIQFLILSLLFGIPLFWLQMCLGARIRAGPVSMWRISPISIGIGIALVVVQYLMAIYSSVIIVWVFVYASDVIRFQSSYRWLPIYQQQYHQHQHNQHQQHYNYAQTYFSNINLSNLTQTIPDYLNKIVLQRLLTTNYIVSENNQNMSGFHISDRLTSGLVVLWTFVFLVLCKGLKSYGKAVFVMGVVPLVALPIVTGKLLSVVDLNRLQASIFNVDELNDFMINSEPWIAAAQETFLTWGLLGASVLAISSRSTSHARDTKTTLRRDALLVVFLTLIALQLSGLIGLCAKQIISQAGYVYVPGSFETGESARSIYAVSSLVNGDLISYPSKLVPHYSSYIGEIYQRHQYTSYLMKAATTGYKGITTTATTTTTTTTLTTTSSKLGTAASSLASKTLPTNSINALPKFDSGYQILRLITELLPAVVVLGGNSISWIWAAVIFIMYFMFAVNQLCVMWKPISSALGNSTSAVLLSCVTGLLLSIPLLTENGINMLHYLDFVLGGAWFIPILWAAQVLGVFLIRGRPYNGDELVNDLRMCGSMSAFLALVWNLLLPMGLFVLSAINYNTSDSSQLLYWKGKGYFQHPAAGFVGAFLQIGLLLVIPIAAIIQIYRYLTSGPADILERIELLYCPHDVDGSGTYRRSAAGRRGALSASGRIRSGNYPGRSQNLTTLSGFDEANSGHGNTNHNGQSNDAPPKYTPPPSYTTATGARLAKILQQSLRRSFRRVMRDTSDTRTNRSIISRDCTDMSTQYSLQSSTINMNGSNGSSCSTNHQSSPETLLSNINPSISETLEISQREDTDANGVLIDANCRRPQSARTLPMPVPAPRQLWSLERKTKSKKNRFSTPAQRSMTVARVLDLNLQLPTPRRTRPFTAEDVVSILRASTRNRHRSISRESSSISQNLYLTNDYPSQNQQQQQLYDYNSYQQQNQNEEQHNYARNSHLNYHTDQNNLNDNELCSINRSIDNLVANAEPPGLSLRPTLDSATILRESNGKFDDPSNENNVSVI